MPALTIASSSSSGPWERLQAAVNFICQPQYFLTLATLLFVAMLAGYRRWTRAAVFWPLATLFCLGYFASLGDADFRAIVGKPDNVPITLMILSVGFFLYVGLRRAAANDLAMERGAPLLEEHKDDKVLVWPDLVYIELILMVLATAALTAWAIVAKAPLEQPANPSVAPNPAKAPWYFLGLQEMLVYFDPWMAGVVYPALIIVGLCAIPYLDVNPKGNGYYTFRQRPFAVATFLFGFIILWVVLIFVGTFLRGPNWEFFGPFERWDVHRSSALTNVDLSNVWWNLLLGRSRPTAADNPVPFLPYWLVREWLGMLLMALYLLALPVLLRRTVFKRVYPDMGPARYWLMAWLLLLMGLMPLKMVLRWLFNVKYFIYLPEFEANL